MMIKKYILFFLISLMFNQDFLPINNQTLNYTQIFFKWPQINNAESYQLYFDNQTEYETINNSIIIDSFDWNNQYSWSVCGIDQSNNIIEC